MVAEREPEFEKLRSEIEKLRAGLSHAEKLATERMDELARIHASPVGKALAFWLRKK